MVGDKASEGFHALEILVIPPNNILRHPITNRVYHVFKYIARRHNVSILDYPCHPHAKLSKPRPIEASIVTYKPIACPRDLGLYYLMNSPIYRILSKKIVREYDLVLIANIQPGLIFSREAFRAGKTCILDFLDYYPEAVSAYYSGLLSSISRSYTWSVVKSIIRYCSRVITVSYSFKHILSRHFNVDVIVVPNGVNEIFKPMDKYVSRQHAGMEGDPLILYYGSIDYWVDLEGLIKGFRKILREYPRSRLYIVGYAHNRSLLYRLLSLARKHDLYRHVFFREPVEYSMLPYIVNSADIVIAPYKYMVHNYTFPLKIVESLSCGVPVITPRIPEYSLWFGKDPVYYNDITKDLPNAIEEAIGRRKHVLGRSCYYRERFSWKRISNLYLDALTL